MFFVIIVFNLPVCAEEFNCAAGHHNYEVIARMEPTTTTDGTETLRCIICSRIHERILFATSHLWGDWEVFTQPTCTEPGFRSRTCTRTHNHHHETERIAPLGHTYRVVITEPTCDQSGLRTYTCTRCGHSYTRPGDAALGCEFKEVVTREPNCIQDGILTLTCIHNSEHNSTKTIPALGHSFDGWIIENPAAEGEDGLEVRLCRLCGERGEERIIPALPLLPPNSVPPLFNNIDIAAGSLSFMFIIFFLIFILPVIGVIRKERLYFKKYCNQRKAEEMEAASHGFCVIN